VTKEDRVISALIVAVMLVAIVSMIVNFFEIRNQHAILANQAQIISNQADTFKAMKEIAQP
jgi:type II secretory pathway component PulK